MKKFIILFGIIGSLTALAVSLAIRKPVSPNNEKVQIVGSFYPLSFFAKEIGGDKVMVTTITASGAEPHDYELTTRDIAHIERSDLLIMNGLLEPWNDRIQDDLKDKKTKIVISSRGLTTQDPHTWLDPILAKKEVAKIAQALEAINPTNKFYYQANEALLVEKLDALDREFRVGLQNCKEKNIITSHAAFGLLASRYGLKEIPIAGISPDSEPSPKQLGELAQFAKTQHIQYIFFEKLVSPKFAETLAREVGAKTLVLNPIEGLTPDEQAAGKDYFLLQRENLDNLKIALQCP